MSNTLVTGVGGFLGSNLALSLSEKGQNVIGMVRDRNLFQHISATTLVFGDVRNYDFVRRVIADYEIENVYHFAASAVVRSCANDPYTTYDVNVMGTVSLLEACRNSGNTVKSIVVSSSDKAFSHSPVPYTEETPISPLYSYEVSKACQQLVSLSYFHNYNLPVKVVACSNVYGPGDPNFSRIIPNTIRKLANNEKAVLYESVADYIREFVYIDDAVSAFILVNEKAPPGNLYCCGGTEHLKVGDLIKKICVKMDKDFEKSVDIVKKPSQFKEVMEQYIDSSKLKKLGWKPKTSLNDGIEKAIAYYKMWGRKNR